MKSKGNRNMKIKLRIRPHSTNGLICQRLVFGLFWINTTDRAFNTPQEVLEFAKLLETTGVQIEWKQTYFL